MERNWSDLKVFPGYTKPQLARIRKAAPDMYKALKAVAYMWREDGTPRYVGQKQEAQELIRLALAKVEGGK